MLIIKHKASHAEDVLVTTAAASASNARCRETGYRSLLTSYHRNGSACLGTRSALKLVAVIGVVKGVVSIKLAHVLAVLAVLAAPLACEYLVRLAAFVVGKLHYDRLGHCDCGCSFQCSSNPHVVRVDGGSVCSGVVAKLVMQRRA